MEDWSPHSLMEAMGLDEHADLETSATSDDSSSSPDGDIADLQCKNLGGFASQVQEEPGEQGAQQIAARGVAGPSSALPHLEQLQRSFGAHDVTSIHASIGGPAAVATNELGAEAYATGNSVAFHHEPSLHTAAHEAAHVVQQRSGVHLKSGVGQPDDIYEQHANAVADLVVQGKSAESLLSERSAATSPATSGRGDQPIQASFISFAVKMGAKKASKAILKKFIKEQIKDKINKIAIKKFASKFAKEADDIMGMLDDPWWVTGIGLIPIVGDVFDLAHVPKQIAKAMKTADRLEEKVKSILRIQGMRARELLPATLQRSASYAEELADKTYAELVQLAASSERAAKMKKLIENESRLMEKL